MVTYTTSGSKTLSAIAYAGGLPCNGNGSITGVVTITVSNPGSSLAAPARSTAALVAGQYVDASASVPSAEWRVD